MGDPTGEPSDRFHPQGLSELFLKPVALLLGGFPLGDVSEEGLVGSVGHELGVHLDRNGSSVLSGDLPLLFEVSSIGQRFVTEGVPRQGIF